MFCWLLLSYREIWITDSFFGLKKILKDLKFESATEQI